VDSGISPLQLTLGIIGFAGYVGFLMFLLARMGT